jgi:hypothetical protein
VAEEQGGLFIQTEHMNRGITGDEIKEVIRNQIILSLTVQTRQWFLL